jgi:hypothetical protein
VPVRSGLLRRLLLYGGTAKRAGAPARRLPSTTRVCGKANVSSSDRSREAMILLYLRKNPDILETEE